MKYLIVGLGKSGLAAYDLLKGEQHDVVGTDQNPQVLQNCLKAGKQVDSQPNLDLFDVIIISPGILPTNPLYQEAIKKNKIILGEAGLALSRLKQQKIIGITGTNGKTTVTLLIEHILKQSGYPAHAVGNIGYPLCRYVQEAKNEDYVIVELSSYQLETLATPCLDLGMILNITPDHLDRYATMIDYAKAKCQIQYLLKQDHGFYIHETIKQQFPFLLEKDYVAFGATANAEYSTNKYHLFKKGVPQLDLPKNYLQLGMHESENVLASWIVCSHLGIDRVQFLQALEKFKKPPHRIEFVTSINGIHYFNDSKGTNVDATIKAVDSLTGAVILIAGGVDKGSSYRAWEVFAHKVKSMIVFGQAAEKMFNELSRSLPIERVENLAQAVEKASLIACTGENILLSPGCASFDMFQDYVHRGNEFKRYILEERSKKE